MIYSRSSVLSGVDMAPLRMPPRLLKEKFITGQNEREETTQDAIVTKSAAFASYEINYLTYITARRVNFMK
jgi:hypothetical protein